MLKFNIRRDHSLDVIRAISTPGSCLIVHCNPVNAKEVVEKLGVMCPIHTASIMSWLDNHSPTSDTILYTYVTSGGEGVELHGSTRERISARITQLERTYTCTHVKDRELSYQLLI